MCLARHACIRQLSKRLARVHIGNMHLGGGNTHGLECVQNRNARVRVSGGVNNNAVKYTVCRLNLIDNIPFVI